MISLLLAFIIEIAMLKNSLLIQKKSFSYRGDIFLLSPLRREAKIKLEELFHVTVYTSQSIFIHLKGLLTDKVN